MTTGLNLSQELQAPEFWQSLKLVDVDASQSPWPSESLGVGEPCAPAKTLYSQMQGQALTMEADF